VLLLPALARRWGWRALLVYGGLVLLVCVVFAWGPGWGLLGPLDGTGLLGALRIYGAYWNYNGGFYHWLEVALSGYPTPGAVPPEVAGWAPIRAARLIAAGLLGLGVVVVWWRSRRTDDDLALLRLVAVLLAAYMLLATTVHPWYVTVIVPLLPFLLPRQGEGAVTEAGGRSGRFLLPAIYFTAAVALSYFTYLDPANLREYDAVRLAEYLPLYLMLIWAAWPASGAADRLGRG
jgi:hypothetical protein